MALYVRPRRAQVDPMSENVARPLVTQQMAYAPYLKIVVPGRGSYNEGTTAAHHGFTNGVRPSAVGGNVDGRAGSARPCDQVFSIAQIHHEDLEIRDALKKYLGSAGRWPAT